MLLGDFLESRSRKLARVALDVDETIADVIPHILKLHNKAKSTDYKLYHIRDWAWTGMNISNMEFRKHYSTVWHKMSHAIDLLVDKALLLEVSRHYEIDLVTKRANVPLVEATVVPLRKWLEKHGMDKYRLVVSDMRHEKDVLEYDIYIDDSPKLAENISKYSNKKLFLVNRPHNKYYRIKSDNIVRVHDVNGALHALIEEAKGSGLKHK